MVSRRIIYYLSVVLIRYDILLFVCVPVRCSLARLSVRRFIIFDYCAVSVNFYLNVAPHFAVLEVIWSRVVGLS